MRRIVVLFFALMLLHAAHALTPSSTSITIVVSEDGSAEVREDYLFVLPTPADKNAFEDLAAQLGNSFQLWIARVDGIDYHLGRDYTELEDISLYVTWASDNVAKLTVSYRVPSAAILVSRGPSRAEYVLSSFHFPVDKGTVFIPEGTSIYVSLPPRARILSYEPVVDRSKRGENMVAWEGPLRTNRMYIRYEIPIPAAAPSIVSILLGQTYGIYFAVALIVLAAVVFLRWKQVSKAIARYVENNTHFEK